MLDFTYLLVNNVDRRRISYVLIGLEGRNFAEKIQVGANVRFLSIGCYEMRGGNSDKARESGERGLRSGGYFGEIHYNSELLCKYWLLEVWACGWGAGGTGGKG